MAESFDSWLANILVQLKFQNQTRVEVFQGNSCRAPGLRVFKILEPTTSFKPSTICYLIVTVPSERGGSFSEENLILLYKFFEVIKAEDNFAPLIFLLNSGGVRVYHPRTIFDSIWGIIPELLGLKKRRLLITVGDKHVLGAAAVFFAQGHFRIAGSPETLINLTGPGIIHQFFGQSENYHQYASAEHQMARHLLIHEQTRTVDLALDRVARLLAFTSGDLTVQPPQGVFQRGDFELGEIPIDLLSPQSEKQESFVKGFADGHFEILPSHSGPGQCYLINRKGRTLGMMMNPLNHSSNLINHKMIEKYQECLNLYRALKLPLVIFTDTPGGDPRQKNSDFNILKKTIDLVENLIDYPYGKIGFIAGRCFGGSGMLALPHVHNSWGLYALKGSKIGVMADEIISQMVDKNPKAKSEWARAQAGHSSDLADLVKVGTIRKVISANEIGSILDHFLTAFPPLTGSIEFARFRASTSDGLAADLG
jgi:acetyl-CoA carboxylase carboxyltransferase component